MPSVGFQIFFVDVGDKSSCEVMMKYRVMDLTEILHHTFGLNIGLDWVSYKFGVEEE